MLQSPSAASSREPARVPSFVQGLRVSIPVKPILTTLLENLRNRDKNKETTIIFSSLLLSHQDIRNIVEAFSQVEQNSNITLIVREMFMNPRNEDPDHLIQFWNAVKGKVQKINWEGNKFHERFRKFLDKEIRENPNVTAKNDFLHTDITNSSTLMSSRTPSSIKSKSVSRSPSASPLPVNSSPHPLRALSIFAPGTMTLTHVAPYQSRQVSAPLSFPSR